MADFAKRSEVTISTMGKVHNPTGEGVKAISSQARAKAMKVEEQQQHVTVVKEGTAKRNITRKKTQDASNYDSSHKKQGGHGKGQWKEVLDISYVDPIAVDEKDPLYDETTDAKYVLSSGGDQSFGYDPATDKPIYGPMLTKAEFKVQLTQILMEYFDSCDATEVITSLVELGCAEYHPEVVKKAVSLSLDQHARERELTSRLLTSLHPTPLSLRDMEEGFSLLLDHVDDLETDVPEAKTMVANFLARAVVDEVVPPAYLSEQNNTRPGSAVLEKAITLLSREHCTARLERIWGPGDGRPVEELKRDMDQLLKEYLLSRELDEAAQCVKELDAPHFHHELVKRGISIAMEAADEASLDAMAALFGFLVRNAIVSEYQVAKGLLRVEARLEDIQLDVPNAPTLLQSFCGMVAEQGCLPVPTTAAVGSSAK